MHSQITIALVSASLVAAFAAPVNAQYIARKLQRESHLQSANGISGNRVVGTYGAQYGVRHRYDGIFWDATNGVPAYEMDGATSFLDVNNDWVIENGEGWSIYSGYSPHSARNLTTGVSYSLGYGAWSQSSGHSAVTTGMRGDWAWGNQTHYAMGSYAYYYIYGSKLVNLTTGETRDYSWDNGPFSYYRREFLDVSDGKVLERTYGSYSLLDIETGVRTSIAVPISVVGMSGTQIAGNSTNGASLHDYTTGQTVTLSKSGMSSTEMKQMGTGESVGNGTNAVTNRQNALRWDNATGAVTNLQNFLGGNYTSSATINMDKANADGSILISADRAGGTDFVALRRFAGTVVGVGQDEIATFEDDHTQTDGVIVNEGTIQWTNPPRWWNLQNGLLTGTGNFYGNINNSGGTLSGGGAGGTGGGGTGGGGFGGNGGAGSGIGAFTSTGSYIQDGTGTLLVSIGGANAFDTFLFGDTATLGGVLEVSLLGGYVPNYRQEFVFFSAPNTVGTWESIYSPGHDWQVRYEPNGATLIYNGAGPVTVPESGTAVFSLLGLLPIGAIYLRRKRA
ncbi:MAG: hypothetical protein H8F28_09465 [Fibrella sp.]|nr:hypothetical protein [Armatimonadota bacterium]